MKESKQRQLMFNSFSSFEIFFKENYHAACLVALRYLSKEQEAEDVVQETFLYLWEKRSQLNVHQSLKQYLFQSVKNRSINYLKREKQFHEPLENSLSYTEDIDEFYSTEELAVQISRSIEDLPPQCKKIFLLAYVENLTYNEISEALSLSKNTIKTQMGIAYKILRQRLKHYFLSLFILPAVRIFG